MVSTSAAQTYANGDAWRAAGAGQSSGLIFALCSEMRLFPGGVA